MYACSDTVLAPCSRQVAEARQPDFPDTACEPAFPWHLSPAGSSSTRSSHGIATAATEASWFASLYGMHYRSMAGVEAHLWRRSSPSGWAYIAERHGSGYDDKMDHLVCFMGGLLGLSSMVAPTAKLAAHHMDLATSLTDTCVNMYTQTATGLAAEITRFPNGGDPVPDPGAKHNLLRPETVESLYVLHRLTGDDRWRRAGWAIFAAFNTVSRVPEGGFATLRDVTVNPPTQNDQQESFWLAETLKYLYLLFSDSATVPPDRYVFNTEAHPLPMWR
jgi:endoplasmic reticulum Man9GlcNAc2 1,2-alpha-mannosidase